MPEALRITSDLYSSTPDADGNHGDAKEPKLIELLQVSLIKAYAAHFSIINEHFVSVHVKRLFRRPVNYWVDLRYVDPMPARVFALDRPALWMTATLALLSASIFLVAWLSAQPLEWLTIAAPLLCAAMIAALLLALRSKKRIVFCSRYGRVPWFELLASKPGRGTVDKFVKTLTSTITEAKNKRSDGGEGKLGAELREHRRLQEGGILSERVYKSVKSRLLKQHGG